MKRRVGLLVAGGLLFGAASLYPAGLLWGEPGWAYCAVAIVICLIPTAATLAWGHWALAQTSDQQMLLVMGGTGLRMGVVLGAGLALYLSLPYFQQPGFWICLLAGYLFTLALEMILLVRRPAPRDGKTA